MGVEQMREYTSPGGVTIPSQSNLLEPLWEHAETDPGFAILAYRSGDQFVDVTYSQFAERVRDIAAGLIGLGVEPGQRVCVMSKTRMEWTYLDYGIWAAGAATVPIYETSSAEQVEWIVSNSEAVVVVVENAELKGLYDSVADRLDGVKNVFVIDQNGIDEIIRAGDSVDRTDVDERSKAITTDDLASLVYTSGTTGRPKGCELTHGNLKWTNTQVAEGLEGLFSEGESTLLFLPLAHIFGRVIQCGCISEKVKLGYSTGIDNLREELQIFKPTFLLSVPRVFEKVYNGAVANAAADGKEKIFHKATDVAIAVSKARRTGGNAGLVNNLLHKVFDKLVYSKLREAVGGRVSYAVSGGAALGERLGYFFDGVGITILEGYGLTETAAGGTLNTPDALKIGSVGRPIPGASVRIADDGEILLKGGQIFQGYWKNEEASAEVLEDDGWFHTGDIGELDDNGFLSITGRKKEIIVTAAGKNVAPAVLEDRLKSHRLVSQAMVVGDDRPFVGALVTIDEEQFEQWATQNDLEGRKVEDAIDHPKVQAEVQNAVEHANKAVSRAESIREYRVLPEDFTIEGGELTPTLKVKRNVVAEKYEPVIEDIYSGK
jgi:long-chain acyl-CoA synthetase